MAETSHRCPVSLVPEGGTGSSDGSRKRFKQQACQYLGPLGRMRRTAERAVFSYHPKLSVRRLHLKVPPAQIRVVGE